MLTIDEIIELKVRTAVDAALASIQSTPPPPSQPRVLGSKEAATYIGLSHHRLAKLRELHRGPAYKKLGVKVVYEVADLDAYVDQLPAVARS